MYSPAKYPIANPPKFIPTFQDFAPSEVDFAYNLQNAPVESMDVKKNSDKLQFFHLKRSRPKAAEKPSLVFNTKSINSLITFVNNENIIYNDPTPKTKPKDVTQPENDDDTTDFSRFSILIKSKHDADNFQYFPIMDQAPEMDQLPMDLPDLPGIADDITFTFSDQELIAPSLAKMNIVNELPNVADLIEAESNKNQQENRKQTNETPEKEADVRLPAPPPVPVNIPPPPPIPQSFIPPAPPVPIASSSAKPAQHQPKSPPADDGRSSLMQAIRSAGGKAKLRSVAAADEQVPTTKKKPPAAPAGDLMSDLHAKLAMRRRGIAGSKEAKKEKASIMDKVSSMIPPPSAKKEESDDDSSSTDNDWD